MEVLQSSFFSPLPSHNSQNKNSKKKFHTISASKNQQKDPKKRVVITGMGVVSVFGNDVDEFYNKLLAGVSGVSMIDRFDPSEFPTKFAAQIRGFDSEGYIDGKNNKRLDNCIRYCIVAGKKAIQSAGLRRDCLAKIDKARAGVLVGSAYGGSNIHSVNVPHIIEKNYKKINPFTIPCCLTNTGSSLLATDLGFMGPVYSISTACATSNHCFYSAANHIREDEVDLMVAGGTDASVCPISLGGFSAFRALSQRNDDLKSASRPWDVDRDGFIMGEGSGVLVMESLEHATRRGAHIIGEYLGGAINCDAHHITKTIPDGRALAACISQALQSADVSPEEVNYINAHGMSSPEGDLAEVNAIKKAFKNRSHIKVNSTKSMIGHCMGASGGMEAIAVLKAITTGWLHPTINQLNLEPCIDFDTVPNVKQQHEINIAISNSFGYGGLNSVAVFSSFKP